MNLSLFISSHFYFNYFYLQFSSLISCIQNSLIYQIRQISLDFYIQKQIHVCRSSHNGHFIDRLRRIHLFLNFSLKIFLKLLQKCIDISTSINHKFCITSKLTSMNRNINISWKILYNLHHLARSASKKSVLLFIIYSLFFTINYLLFIIYYIQSYIYRKLFLKIFLDYNLQIFICPCINVFSLNISHKYNFIHK